MKLPNILTLARMVMVPLFIIVYYIGFTGWNYVAAALFIVASLTDLFDGMLARKMDCVSNFGKLMDPIADKLLVTAALLMLMDWGKIGALIPIIIIGREFIISGFRLLATSAGVVIAAGPIGKVKTALQMVGISIILLENPIFRDYGIPMGDILLYISAALAIWSCVEYIYKNRQLLRG